MLNKLDTKGTMKQQDQGSKDKKEMPSNAEPIALIILTEKLNNRIHNRAIKLSKTKIPKFSESTCFTTNLILS
jgi:hypothetical protein